MGVDVLPEPALLHLRGQVTHRLHRGQRDGHHVAAGQRDVQVVLRLHRVQSVVDGRYLAAVIAWTRVIRAAAFVFALLL